MVPPNERPTTIIISSVGFLQDNCGTYALLSKAPLSSLVEQILAVRGQGDSFQEIYICGEIAGKGVQKGVAIVALEVRGVSNQSTSSSLIVIA